MKTVLTIAGFDPSSGAGVTADLMVFAAHGLFGTACVTALTVQSTVGVRSTHPTDVSVVGATLECLQADLPPAGIKIGMLANSDNILRICKYLVELRQTHEGTGEGELVVVLDPVLRSTSGRELIDASGLVVMRERLLPLVDWITPNVDELAALSGHFLTSRDDLPAACRSLQAQIAESAVAQRLGIVATGGHLDRPDDFVLTPAGEEFWLPGERVVTQSTHGTGCAFSSAFLSRLVLGEPPHAAGEGAKAYVTGALQHALPRGIGASPMNHLWKFLNPED
jgi:hydroxymethylpyrimidine/phosphomethylpyrimidine kinase